VEGDEGGALATAERSLEALVEQNIDVLVGPASSRIALGLLSDALDSDLTVCSPTNTAISLTRYPDQRRYFRTIPSDALQARALARLIERTGLNAVAIVYIDDEFGEDYRNALTRELESREITVVSSSAFDPEEDDLLPAGIRAVASGAGAIAVIGDQVDGGRMLATLRGLDQGDADYFLNDALRMPNLAASLGGGSPEAFLGRLRGVAPAASSEVDEFNDDFALQYPNTPIEFAAYAYDCTMLLALAATAADSDDPERIARAMTDVSRGGSPCSDFAQCRELIDDGRNIDYVGASGDVEIDENGDVTTGSFDIFHFEPSGLDTLDGSDIDIP
jgi:branched-chain amino acid transport system substrate-binding protein